MLPLKKSNASVEDIDADLNDDPPLWVKLHSLPAGQYCFDARCTLQAVKSAAYMSQCTGVLKPGAQCECPVVADDLVA